MASVRAPGLTSLRCRTSWAYLRETSPARVSSGRAALLLDQPEHRLLFLNVQQVLHPLACPRQLMSQSGDR